jgi:hypothetical protein
MPRNNWNMKTNTVAAYAHGAVPIDNRIEVITKQKQRPAAETMSDTRRPNLSILHKGMTEPTRYAREVQPPRTNDKLRDRFMAFCFGILAYLSSWIWA